MVLTETVSKDKKNDVCRGYYLRYQGIPFVNTVAVRLLIILGMIIAVYVQSVTKLL